MGLPQSVKKAVNRQNTIKPKVFRQNLPLWGRGTALAVDEVIKPLLRKVF